MNAKLKPMEIDNKKYITRLAIANRRLLESLFRRLL